MIAMVAIAILLGQRMTTPTAPKAQPHERGKPVHDFDAILRPGYRIFRQTFRPVILPIRYHLELIPPQGKHVAIRTLDDFGGGLSVRSKQDALTYVRLRTRYMYDFPLPFAMELSVFGKHVKGAWLAPKRFAKELDAYPMVTQTADGFRVVRMLITYDGKHGLGKGVLVRAEETVTTDGHWSEVDHAVHGALANQGWPFPLQE